MEHTVNVLKDRIEWRYKNKLHRTDRPAVEYIDGDKFWYQNGKLHRTDGPAIEYVNGYKAWYQNGKLHRTDGPAVEYPDGSESWYQNGKLHRTDGPAIEWPEWPNGVKEWWIDDKQLTEEEFLAKTNPCATKKLLSMVRNIG